MGIESKSNGGNKIFLFFILVLSTFHEVFGFFLGGGGVEEKIHM